MQSLEPRRTPALATVVEHLASRSKSGLDTNLRVPDVIFDTANYHGSFVSIADGCSFFLDRIVSLLELAARPPFAEASRPCRTLLFDLRTIGALNARQGSFLALIAWLPLIVTQLKCRQVVLLPVARYGRTRRKGRDGSVFSVSEHFSLDPGYADPLLDTIPLAVQYRAAIELAGLLGVRIGTVQPLVSASLDCPRFAIQPELTFWWAADPGEVLYSPYPSQTCSTSTPYLPPESYSERFVEPPLRQSIRLVRRPEGVYFVGKSRWRGRMVDVSIPNAIPDVVPNLPEQYAWRDIAILNYWNTRVLHPGILLGSCVTKPDSVAATTMSRVMNLRARRFGESIFWLDMARCLPEMVRNSATQGTRFFSRPVLIHETVVGQGYPHNTEVLTVGDFLYKLAPRHGDFTAFRGKLLAYLHRFTADAGKEGGRFLAGAGTHDTVPPEPRILALLTVLAHILPRAEPLLLSGQERYCADPINAEFGELPFQRYSEESLSLFSIHPDAACSGLSADEQRTLHNLPPLPEILDLLWRLHPLFHPDAEGERRCELLAATGEDSAEAPRILNLSSRGGRGVCGAVISLSRNRQLFCWPLANRRAWFPLRRCGQATLELRTNQTYPLEGVDIILFGGPEP